MTKTDRTFEVGKKYVNRTSRFSDFEDGKYQCYAKDGYVILLSRTPKIVFNVDRFGHVSASTMYPVDCNGKRGWCELKSHEDNYESLHRVTASGKNWAPHSVGNCAEIY